MEKCDVCGKTSLLPEKMGQVKLCKVCYMKVGGPLWKRQYEKQEDVEKNRNKALAAAHKENFPPKVVSEINEFFLHQTSTMQTCDACGMEVQHLSRLGERRVCLKCYSKLDVELWNEETFEDNKEVEQYRNRILKKARKNDCSAVVIEEINKYFDSKVEKDLRVSINNDKGQVLKIYNTRCVLITEEFFDVKEMTKEYEKALGYVNGKESLQIIGMAATLVSPMLPGGALVRKGARAVGSHLSSAAQKMPSTSRPNLNVIKGSYEIDYRVYTSADFKECGDEEEHMGFIRFYRKGGDESDAVVFMFDDCAEKVQAGYKAICEGINNAVIEGERIQKQSGSSVSSADELRKFKQLLDDGIITEKEFEYKKKELLGMDQPNDRVASDVEPLHRETYNQIKQGNKLNAIKALRGKTGMSLLEATREIEKYEQYAIRAAQDPIYREILEDWLED